MHSQESREVFDGVHPDGRRQLVHPRIQQNCEDRLVLSVVAMRLQLGLRFFIFRLRLLAREISKIEVADQTRYVQLARGDALRAQQHQLASIS